MKYLVPEHSSLKKIINSSEFDYVKFVFVKKNGLLYIKHPQKDIEFILHRDNETTLDKNKHWKKSSTYKIHSPFVRENIRNWQEVLDCFSEWLNVHLKST